MRRSGTIEGRRKKPNDTKREGGRFRERHRGGSLACFRRRVSEARLAAAVGLLPVSAGMIYTAKLISQQSAAPDRWWWGKEASVQTEKKLFHTHIHAPAACWEMNFFLFYFFASAEPSHNSAAFISPHRAMTAFFQRKWRGKKKERTCTTDTFSHSACMRFDEGVVLIHSASVSRNSHTFV